MNKLEAQMIVENTGNYNEEDVEEIMDTYEELMKNVGFEDNRRDKRYIVKFHDIFYDRPDGIEVAEIANLFESFCYDMIDNVETQLTEENVDLDMLLTGYCVGHYQTFMIDIPEITEENALEMAMGIVDELGYTAGAKDYVENYVKTVNILQDLEDNYMIYWLEFLEANEFPNKYIKEIKKNMERRQAK